MRVDLPRGHWVELKGPDELTGKDLKLARQAGRVHIRKDDDDGAEGDVSLGIMDDLRDVLAARVITAWSLDQPIPNGNVEAVENLPADLYAALSPALQDHLALAQMRPNSSSSSD